jgi:hypothetical protein
MSKRIRELIELAYATGYHSCRLERPDGIAHEDIAALRVRHAREVEQRNAACDALEAALAEASDVLQNARDTFREDAGYDTDECIRIDAAIAGIC